jgi:hypothetical protein
MITLAPNKYTYEDVSMRLKNAEQQAVEVRHKLFFLRQALEELAIKDSRHNFLSEYYKDFVEHYGFTINCLISPKRLQPLSYIRKVIIDDLYHNHKLNTIKIGKLLNRDHSSIVVAKNTEIFDKRLSNIQNYFDTWKKERAQEIKEIENIFKVELK